MNRLRSGFTLMDLLVVIFIVIIVGIVIINSFFVITVKKKENKDGVKTEVKVEKPFSRFIVRVQELEINNKQPSYLVCIQDTKTGQEWLAVRHYGLMPIVSSTSAQFLKCEADNK